MADKFAHLDDGTVLKWVSATDGQFLKRDGTTIVSGAGILLTDGDKGDITVSSSGTVWTIDNDVVTFAKMQNITDARLLGRSAGSAGDCQEITVGTGLSLAAGSLTASVTNALLDGANHTDTVAQTVSRGSLIYGNSTPKWDELVIGASARVLQSDGTDVSWVAISGAISIAAGGATLIASLTNSGSGIASNLTFDLTPRTISTIVSGGAGVDGVTLTIKGGDGSPGGAGAAGGTLLLDAGAAQGASTTATVKIGPTNAYKVTLCESSTGGGVVIQIGGGTAVPTVRFMEPSGSGTNYTEFQAAAQAGNVTYTLPTADGTAYRSLRTDGAGVLSWQQSLVQIQYSLDGAVATGTTTTPLDDTIPQNTEGTQLMSVTITPKNASNLLLIVVFPQLALSIATTMIVGAIHQDSTANALAAALFDAHGESGAGNMRGMAYVMTAGTTSATTFKFRAGGGAASTVTFNGFTSARKMGGVMSSLMAVIEFSA